MTPEWSRPVRIDTIGDGERSVVIDADADERRRLAARFGLLAIDRLEARFDVRRDGAAILATGVVSAMVTQSCAASGQPIPAVVDEAVTLRFVDESQAGEDEVELSADALDTLPIEGGAIDLGEAAAETLALAINPFRRAPGGDAVLRDAGVIGEDEVQPFNAFAALKDRLR